MAWNPVYVVDIHRTAVGKALKGSLAKTRPDDLLAFVIRAMREKYAQLDWEQLSDVIIGCAMPEAEQGMNIARVASLMAGLPEGVPGMTINRFCSSGLQSIALAAQQIALGDADLMLAGGVESMSLVPMGGHKFAANPHWFEQDGNLAIAYGMGITAEKVAQKWQVSRQDQDQFALSSHQKALAAQQAGAFKQEILPYPLAWDLPNLATGIIEREQKTFQRDEGPRLETSLEALAALKPSFALKGSVTAGNSSQMSDGAGIALLASERMLKKYQLTPLAKMLSYSVAGVSPQYMGIGPVAAIPKALAQAGLSLSKVDWIELNEAFAAQAVAVIRDLKLEATKVNPCGGAIALGHPLGATGAIRTATLLHGLHREKLRYGMVTMCIGTGMGAAGIFARM